MTIRILIADDHGVVRNGLRDMLQRRAGFEVAAEAATGTEALYLAGQDVFDLIVLDISLPGCSGIKVLQELRAGGSTVPVLFFSMHPPDQYAAHLRQIGAQGFLGKEAGMREVLAVIDRILSGRTHFPTLRGEALRTRLPAADPARLSTREKTVMYGIINGKPQVDIARELGITNKSVGTYRRRILDKLGVANNVELAALAARLGLIG